MERATRSRPAPVVVDATDWLKTAAIVLVTIDHIGLFHFADEQWWRLVGRWAAPVFFFLLGYAETQRVPPIWIVAGVILTVLDSWSTNWHWVPPNILLSLALIRWARPYVKPFAETSGWLAFAVILAVLIGLRPLSGEAFDYGTVGWMWAALGLYQRMRADAAATTTTDAALLQRSLSMCLIAALFHIWEQQNEFTFPAAYFAVLVAGIAVLASVLVTYRRRPSVIQPPVPIAGPLRFIGHHTLEIYALQMIAFELLALAARAGINGN
jgi:uncharacterized membrane protein